MKPFLPLALRLAAMTVVAASLAACNRGGSGVTGASGAGDALAVVNGERISKDDYYIYLERMARVRAQTGQGVVPVSIAGGSIGFQGLEDMINRQAILQVAKDEGVAPTSADVLKELQYRQSQKADFLKTLMGSGYTQEAIRNELRISLAEERVITKGIQISDAEIDRYIKGNPKEFQNPKVVQMQWIVVGSAEKKAQVDEQLRGRQAFGVVAAQLSEAPGARTNSGQFPQNRYDSFTPGLKKLADATAEGSTTDWVKEGNQSIKFLVVDKIEASPINITPVIKETVKRKMALARGAKGSDFQKKVRKKVLEAKVEITNPTYQTAWKTAIDQAKAADPSRVAAR